MEAFHFSAPLVVDRVGPKGRLTAMDHLNFVVFVWISQKCYYDERTCDFYTVQRHMSAGLTRLQ
jgi:hypothetical protein